MVRIELYSFLVYGFKNVAYPLVDRASKKSKSTLEGYAMDKFTASCALKPEATFKDVLT